MTEIDDFLSALRGEIRSTTNDAEVPTDDAEASFELTDDQRRELAYFDEILRGARSRAATGSRPFAVPHVVVRWAACLFAVLLPVLNRWQTKARSQEANLGMLDTAILFRDDFVVFGVGIGIALLVVFGVVAYLTRLGGMWRGLATSAVLYASASGIILAIAHVEESQVRDRLNGLFLEHRWVAYEPPSFDPSSNPRPDGPQVLEDLRRLHAEAGFDGLVTFGTHGSGLPRLAQEAGFTAVIVGIHIDDGQKPAEAMQNAIEYERSTRASNGVVVGYCMGHNEPPTVRLEDLASWMEELRKATGKPVSSTFPIASYVGPRGERICKMGDWYFPDCVASWQIGCSVERAVAETRRAVEQIGTLPGTKPVLMKMMSYPSGPEANSEYPGLSPADQARFFEWLTRDLYLPPGVHASLYSAYDLPWKSKPTFGPPDRFTGIFDKDGKAKEKALDIVKRGWPVQHRR